MEKQFVKFLKARRLYTAWKRNIPIHDEVLESDPKYFISTFLWEWSFEGDEFWSNLDKEWLKELENIEKEYDGFEESGEIKKEDFDKLTETNAPNRKNIHVFKGNKREKTDDLEDFLERSNKEYQEKLNGE